MIFFYNKIRNIKLIKKIVFMSDIFKSFIVAFSILLKIKAFIYW